jgi:hypothetical protein
VGPRGAAPRGGRRASGPPPTNQLKPPREAEAANAYPCHTVPSPGLRAPPPMTPLELTCPAVEQTSRTGQLPPLFATAHARGGFRRPPPLASSKLVGSGGVQQRGELRQLHDGRGGGAATQGAQQGQEGRSLLPLLLPRGIAWLTARERPRATQRMRLPSGVRSRRPRAPPRAAVATAATEPPSAGLVHGAGSSAAGAGFADLGGDAWSPPARVGSPEGRLLQRERAAVRRPRRVTAAPRPSCAPVGNGGGGEVAVGRGRPAATVVSCWSSEGEVVDAQLGT